MVLIDLILHPSRKKQICILPADVYAEAQPFYFLTLPLYLTVLSYFLSAHGLAKTFFHPHPLRFLAGNGRYTEVFGRIGEVGSPY